MVIQKLLSLMKPISILVASQKYYESHQSSVIRSFYSIKRELERVSEVKDVWVVEEGGSSNSNFGKVYNAFEFHNALEIVEIVKPDLILTFTDFEYLSRTMLLAAKYKKIPCVVLLSLFFETELMTQEQFKRVIRGRVHILRNRGTIIIKKYLFMTRTMRQVGYGWGHLIKAMFNDLYLASKSFEPRYKHGGGDLNIVSTPTAKDLLLKNGIEQNKIAVTGECGMDYLYEKIKSIEQTNPSNPQKQVLFLTEPMVEHGFWTESQSNNVLTSILKIFLPDLGSEWKLRIKIHPTSESKVKYQRILESLHTTTEVLQSEDIVQLIAYSDVVLAFGHSSAVFAAVLLRKPIILLNFNDDNMTNNIFLNFKVAYECRSPQGLVKLLRSEKLGYSNDENINKLIETTLFQFDGKCSQRAANYISQILKKV